MPVLVYILMVLWLAFAGWLTWSSKAALDKMPDAYFGHDLLLRMLRGTLPPAQQKLQVRHLVLTFTSLVILAALVLLTMIWHTAHGV